MRIAFALLAHQHPRVLERLISILVGAGHVVSVHFDRRASTADYSALAKRFDGNSSVRIISRFPVRWGQWSIVAATLCCLDEIAAAGWEPEYVYLMSGSDYPIRSASELEGFLARHQGREFIECVPSDLMRWVRGGPQRERYQYRFYFNWRDNPRLFEFAFALQKRLKLKRKFVRGFEPHMGSQWWVLTWNTLKQIMALAREPDIARFFRSTLIPDELFFQTLVHHLVPGRQIFGRPLTLYHFTDYGVPVVYYLDHADFLLRQPFFMARKLSPYNHALFDLLDACWRGERGTAPISDSAVGKVGSEYEKRRIAYREGPPGLPVVGQSPDKWSEDLGRLAIPYFAILSSSTAELAIIRRVLSIYPNVRIHGQIFHPERSEFAEDVSSFAGYSADDSALRNISAPNYIADLVRAEKSRMSGFMLRAGQGWHIDEVMFDRPNVRVAVIKSDRMISFAESLLPVHPHLDEAFDSEFLTLMPAETLARRFKRHLEEFQKNADRWAKLLQRAVDSKPPGWAIEIDLESFSHSLALERWLGIDPDWPRRAVMWESVDRDLARLKNLRQLIASTVASCPNGL